MTCYPFELLWRWKDYLIREFRYFLIFKWYSGRFNKYVRSLFDRMINMVIHDKEEFEITEEVVTN